MIVSVAVCPHPPLLFRELNGQQDAIPEVREACAQALRDLIEHAPDVIVVVGGAEATCTPQEVGTPGIRWYGTSAPRTHRDAQDTPAPLSLAVAHRLLTDARWSGRTSWQPVAFDAGSRACEELGRELGRHESRLGLLVMADGSARRGEKAPGYVDDRAHAFDAHVVRALEDGQHQMLEELDVELADQLMVQGRAALHVLGSAVRHAENAPAARLLYAGDPFGVFYFVATWSFQPAHNS